MRQTWFGLSPLMIAVAKANQTCTRDNTGTNNTTLLIGLLLDNGADPSQGIPYEQFNILRKLKAKKYMRRLNILDNQIETSGGGGVGGKEKMLPKGRTVPVPNRFNNHCINNKNNNNHTKLNAERMNKFAKEWKEKWVFPLDIAAVNNNLEVVRMLLSRSIFSQNIFFKVTVTHGLISLHYFIYLKRKNKQSNKFSIKIPLVFHFTTYFNIPTFHYLFISTFIYFIILEWRNRVLLRVPFVYSYKTM